MERKKFNFGKIDYFGCGRKINPVEVEICLREDEPGKLVFTASGTIYNQRKTKCFSCGQNLDEINKFVTDNTFLEIYRLWKLYHLNNMHAGTKAQERLVKEYLKDHDYDYREICQYLMLRGLYEDHGYKYGSAWLYEEIPENDLLIIKTLLDY